MARVLDCLSGLLLIAAAGIAATSSAASPKTTQLQQSPEVATRGQREAIDVSYGGWQKLCFKAGGAPTLCRTSITGRLATGQTAVRIDLIEREDVPTARLQLFVPVGMYLQQAPTLAVDQGAAFRIPYTWCLTNLCIAADVVAPTIIEDMENGETLRLELVDSNLLVLTTSIPLAQFASAHKGAPARTLEQYVDE